MESLKVNDKIIEYVLERKRIKNLYISVKNGQVTLKVPTRTSQEKIEELICRRADWILKSVESQKSNGIIPKKYVDGEIFKVLGKETVLKISYDNIKRPKFKFLLNKFLVTLPIECRENSSEKVKKLIDKFYFELAEKEVEKAMRKISMQVGIAPNNYKIKNLKSTWGNCSSTRNISINKNIVMYSKHAIEYVCLHEICHLKHMNHSKKFWNLVEKYMPDYKQAEKELKN